MQSHATHDVFPAPEVRREIDVIAARLSKDEDARRDLRQEMLCHLLALPAGQAKKFYARSLRRHAALYCARVLLDAPMGSNGWPLLGRQTVPVGGLAELDRIHRRHAA